MRKMTNQTAWMATLLLLAGAAGCAEVEAEVPEAQVTQKGVSFRGGGWGGHRDEVSATQTFELSATNLSWVKDLNSKVYLTQIDFRAASGVQDLGFIHFAHVSMSDGERRSKPVELVNYVRPDGQPATATIAAKTPYPVDISKVWTADKLLVTVSVAGDLPDKSWSVDVTLHLSGSISYKL
jgi:hypothetical protein